LASDWGSRLVDVGNCGHINADSGLDDWSRGHALLEEFLVSVE
jgi:predicted alpha/beta hydrolase family esterase